MRRVIDNYQLKQQGYNLEEISETVTTAKELEENLC
jgi:hypothetical protein